MTGARPLSRRLVEAAVALSPEAHRETRREQWLADLDGSADLDLSAFRLAMGAFTTALFHRRTGHRSTWGEAVAAGSRLPGRVGAARLLIGLAFASMILGSFLIVDVSRFNGDPASPLMMEGCLVLFALVPGLLYMAALLTGRRSPLVWRVLAAVPVLPLCLIFGGEWVGAFRTISSHDWIGFAVVFPATTAVWFVARGVRGVRWALVALPLAVFAASYPVEGFALDGHGLSGGLSFVVLYGAALVPFVGCLIAGSLGTRHRDARTAAPHAA